MNRSTTVAPFIVGLLLMSTSSAAAQTWGRQPVPPTGVCFYENIDFGGQYFCVRVGEATARVPSGSNDRISSIRLFGDADVTVFRDKDFQGRSQRFDNDMSDLRRGGWNDRISSFRVGTRGYSNDRGGGGGGRGYGDGDDADLRWGRPTVPGSGACFYEHAQFGGRYFCARAGATKAQVPPGTNDRISSIRVFGNAEVTVFRDIDFQGRSQRFEYDMSDLKRSGWNDRISSFQIGRQNAGRGSWGGTPGDGRSGGRDGPSGASRWSYQQAEAMVRRGFISVLGREADPDGLRSWTNEVMRNNWSEAQLLTELRKTPEARRRR